MICRNDSKSTFLKIETEILAQYDVIIWKFHINGETPLLYQVCISGLGETGSAAFERKEGGHHLRQHFLN